MFRAWDRLDRDKALAYRELQRSTCPQCGTRAEEWPDELDADADEPYVTHLTRCRGCQAVGHAQDDIPKGPEAHGVKVSLVPPGLIEALRIAAELKQQIQQDE